jgi:hypothetical protein
MAVEGEGEDGEVVAEVLELGNGFHDLDRVGCDDERRRLKEWYYQMGRRAWCSLDTYVQHGWNG